MSQREKKVSQTYDHLVVEPSLGMRLDYRIRRLVGALFTRIYVLRKAFELLESGVGTIRNCMTNYAPLALKRIAAGDEAGGSPQAFGSGFGYGSEVKEVETAAYYRSQLQDPGFATLPSESASLYETVLAEMRQLLRSTPSIKRVVDFGVSYGHVDDKLAMEFGGVQFDGVDRSRLTVAYNQNHLPKRGNLAFHAADIFEHLQTARCQSGEDGILFHMRTACLMPKEFLARLYADAAACGYRHVVLAEQVGMSWETGSHYRFSDEDQPSVILRTFMFIHNYPGILGKAGYRVKNSQLVETKHRDKNLRLLFIHAERT